MTTTEIIELVGLLATVVGLVATQWYAVLRQRDADKESVQKMVDALRNSMDEEVLELHRRIDKSETIENANLREGRLSTTLVRLEAKLDRLIERQIPGNNPH